MKIVSRKLRLISIMLFSITVLQFLENKIEICLLLGCEPGPDCLHWLTWTKYKGCTNKVSRKRRLLTWKELNVFKLGRRGEENIIIPTELKWKLLSTGVWCLETHKTMAIFTMKIGKYFNFHNDYSSMFHMETDSDQPVKIILANYWIWNLKLISLLLKLKIFPISFA